MLNGKCEINIKENYLDPEDQELEIVERKGLGHPDTLADGVANAVSKAFSKYCLDNFGVILHHNVDKVFIGGGMFKKDFGKSKMIEPVKIVINGRMSDVFGDQKIDLEKIQKKAALDYISSTLPRGDIKRDFKVNCNSTQFTGVNPYWYKPRNKDDLPEYKNLVASDTSVCVAHSPRSTCETLAYELEQYFWVINGKRKVPRYRDIGQDIKVMVVRRNREIDVTMCIPVIIDYIKNREEYINRLAEIEREVNVFAKKLISHSNYKVNVLINPDGQGRFRDYLLSLGSCIECGEEGLVGRGNNNNGVISVFRPYSMEAPFGKNPTYHTGRVLSFLSQKLADKINEEMNIKCTIIALAKNKNPLKPPSYLFVNTNRPIQRDRLKEIIDTVFKGDHLAELLRLDIK